MKPNPEQDADRAAFEKWTTREPGTYAYHHECGAWQAAKADSRAMQTATIGSDNTQTVYNLLEERKQMQGAFEQVCAAATALADDFSEYYDDSEEQNGERLHTVHKMRKILSLAAPFRKTGV